MVNARIWDVPTYAVIISDITKASLASERLKEHFGENVREIATNAWLLKSSHVSQEVSRMVSPRGEDGSADISHVVFLVTGWSGYYSKSIWEWLNLPTQDDKPGDNG